MMGRGWGWFAAAVVCLTWACGPTVEEATGGLPDTGQPPPALPDTGQPPPGSPPPPAPVRSESGACQDWLDNDGDGAMDCADPECDGVPACIPSACAAVDLGSTLPVRHVGATSAEHVRFAPSCTPGDLSSERVHAFTPPHSGHYVISVRRQDADDAFLPMLHILADCAGETELACVPARELATGRSQWLEGGKPVLLVVRDTAGREDGYELTVTGYVDREAGLCGDGLDNDADGRRDAEDTDCVGTCSPTRCVDLKASCGEYSDGCGGTLQCGSCGDGRTCGAVIPGACGKCLVSADLGSALPLRHSGMPEGFLNYIPWHGEVLSSTFTWTAPRTGDYVISNAGSGASSRMTVRLGSCNGQEVPGSNPLLPNRYSLKAGETVYLTLFGDGARLGWVDSYYHLHITEAAPGGEQGQCADRLDNDGDGTVDCQDAECGSTPECRGNACADVDLGHTLPAWGSTPTSRGYNFFRPSCGHGYYPGRDERVYTWTAPKAGRYVFHGRWRDGLISLRDGCAGPELACVNRGGVGQSLERAVLVRDVSQGETVIVVLEGTEGEDELPVPNSDQLFVHEWAPEEGPGLCDDQRDNDGDGLTDELDPGC